MLFKQIFVSLAIMLSCLTAQATDMVARQGLNSIRLTQNACNDVVKQHISVEHQADSKGGYAVIEGQSYLLCWKIFENALVAIVFDDGDFLQVPVVAFEAEEGV